MKKLCLSILASLALTLGLVSQVQADEYLRIGMEAAYAPFNWTQDDDSNGAVKSTVPTNMPTATMFKSLKRLPKT